MGLGNSNTYAGTNELVAHHAVIAATHVFIPDSLVAVGAEMISAVVVYAIAFLLGISHDERRFYVSKLAQMGGRLRPRAAAVSEGA